MKKFKLIGINEWTKDNLNNPLDIGVYNILTSDKPQTLKLEEYKNLISEFLPTGSVLGEIKGAEEVGNSKNLDQSDFHDYERELLGRGENFHQNYPEKKEHEGENLDISQSSVSSGAGERRNFAKQRKRNKRRSYA